MPTAKPRITIKLTEEQYRVLSSLSQLQKVSMSSIVVDLVESTLPVLDRLAGVLHNAAIAPQSFLAELKKSFERAENEAGFAMLDELEEFAGIEQEPVRSKPRAARAGSPSGARVAAQSTRPPTSNRGVRITSPLPKIGSISPMKKGEKNGRADK